MFELWMLTAGANAIMVVVYALVAIEMLRAIIDGRQLTTNPLLTATAAVFVTCTLGHGAHLLHAISATAPFWGTSGDLARAAVRAEFGDMRLLVWDVVTALVAIYFYTLRSRFAVVYRGAALCEDMAQREKDARDMHDNIVQGLAQAKLALDMGQQQEGYDALQSTLQSSRRIITNLLGKQDSEIALGPGELRRDQAAGRAP